MKKLFYSITADSAPGSVSVITKSNQITFNPSESTDFQDPMTLSDFRNNPGYFMFSQPTVNYALINKNNMLTGNPFETEEIQYWLPKYSYEKLDYKTDFILPGANLTNPNI